MEAESKKSYIYYSKNRIKLFTYIKFKISLDFQHQELSSDRKIDMKFKIKYGKSSFFPAIFLFPAFAVNSFISQLFSFFLKQ